jgi:hypothetical protein
MGWYPHGSPLGRRSSTDAFRTVQPPLSAHSGSAEAAWARADRRLAKASSPALRLALVLTQPSADVGLIWRNSKNSGRTPHIVNRRRRADSAARWYKPVAVTTWRTLLQDKQGSPPHVDGQRSRSGARSHGCSALVGIGKGGGAPQNAAEPASTSPSAGSLRQGLPALPCSALSWPQSRPLRAVLWAGWPARNV